MTEDIIIYLFISVGNQFYTQQRLFGFQQVRNLTESAFA